jgi:hypothetical protein
MVVLSPIREEPAIVQVCGGCPILPSAPHAGTLYSITKVWKRGKTACLYKTLNPPHIQKHWEALLNHDFRLSYCGWTSDTAVSGQAAFFFLIFPLTLQKLEWSTEAFSILPSVLFFPATVRGPYLPSFFMVTFTKGENLIPSLSLLS